MAEITLFDHSDYREYLEQKFKSKAFGRGGKAKLAEHLSCQPSFVSQVLKGKSTLSLEQAYKVNSFLEHNKLQKEFFMLLVEIDRAGSVDLKNFLLEKKEELIEKSKLVENQMSYDQLSEADSIAYYGNVNHLLIRNLVDIPSLRTVEALRERLNISKEEFSRAYNFLTDKGLIKVSKDGVLQRGNVIIHLKKNSPLLNYANISVRMHILKIYEKTNADSMNYASYMTIPRSRFDEFKKKLVALMVDLNKGLEDGSEAEMMAALVIDFMEI